MTTTVEVVSVPRGSIIAPAGHGKTELIACAAAEGRRTLILTHTHAGVTALRNRLKANKVSQTIVAIDTISGWCLRYAHAFPKASAFTKSMPETPSDWDALYEGVVRVIALPAVAQVIQSSYDRILIDEYQDCVPGHHEVAKKLAALLPTVLFGDPMQGVFEFAGAKLIWQKEVHPFFPPIGSLPTPHRWTKTNPALGRWIAETREKLIRGERIDLRDDSVEFRQSDDAFDMTLFFEGHEEKNGSFAALHCRKDTCYKLAKATSGFYQAIEENAGKELGFFAKDWDDSKMEQQRRAAFESLFKKSFRIRDAKPTDTIDQTQRHQSALNESKALMAQIGQGTGLVALIGLFRSCRASPYWKLFRSELWRDAERAAIALDAGRAETMRQAADQMRHRASIVGRCLPDRTVSTPLLLKGLEFEHVLIPAADHFNDEDHVPAKLFYCAISRAKRTLTISASTPFLQFPVPVI